MSDELREEYQYDYRKAKPNLFAAASVVHSDPDILGCAPVFVNPRVPLRELIAYLCGGQALAEFLEDFPTVTRDQAVAALRMAAQALTADVRSA